MRSARLWVVLILLVGAAVVLHARGDVDRVPESRPLDELPTNIAQWKSFEVPLSEDVRQVLGKGVFLNRVYTPSAEVAAGSAPATRRDASVGLFIGYFPTQRTGQSIHSPQNCLPGAGWVFETSGVTAVKRPDGPDAEVGEYLISNGAAKAEVLYWYQSHGRSIASDYKAKLYMLSDSIRYARTDAALVRIVTPLLQGEDVASAHERAVAFATDILPMLPAYVPN